MTGAQLLSGARHIVLFIRESIDCLNFRHLYRLVDNMVKEQQCVRAHPVLNEWNAGLYCTDRVINPVSQWRPIAIFTAGQSEILL